jgi:hypothetical protein
VDHDQSLCLGSPAAVNACTMDQAVVDRLPCLSDDQILESLRRWVTRSQQRHKCSV